MTGNPAGNSDWKDLTAIHFLTAENVMKSIMGNVADSCDLYRFARVLRPSGWRGGYKRTNVQVGYHKQLPRAEMKALAFRLQHQASR